jgi:predicted phosphate transport protein (TIGR00153 family)
MGWFGKRKEDSVRTGSRSHCIAVLDAVTELDMAVQAMAGGNAASAMKCVERLMLCEHEADRIEDRLCAEISGGELSVQEREDLIHFVRKMDHIANWSKEAALHIQLIKETGSGVPEEIWRQIEKMSSELIPAVKHLINAVETLGSDNAETVRNVDAVNDQERIVDGLYFESIKKVHLSSMDPKAVMLVRELILSLEMAADTCKACADTMTILISSRRM